ncbi:MAG: lipoyl protein ligase domain-containing protein [Myxococcota bacterium]
MVGDAPSPTADGAALLRAIPDWRVVDDRAGGTAAERLDRDRQLLEAVRVGRAPPTARLWENVRCLVAARSERDLPGLEAARAQLATRGWPVLVRDSGGTAVPHAPGILQLSLAFRPPEHPLCTLASVYAALALPLQRGLARLGVAAAFGDVPGSFCDGRFNLVAHGRKLAGTAQRWRARPGATSPGRGAVLAHALLLVSGDLTEWTETVNAFYSEAGSTRRYDPAASITVAECVGESGAPLVEKVRATLLEELGTLLT